MSARKRAANQEPEITGSLGSGKNNTSGNQLFNSYLKLEDLHPLNRYTPDVISLSDNFAFPYFVLASLRAFVIPNP